MARTPSKEIAKRNQLIFKEFIRGNVSKGELSRKYGLSKKQIRNIIGPDW